MNHLQLLSVQESPPWPTSHVPRHRLPANKRRRDQDRHRPLLDQHRNREVQQTPSSTLRPRISFRSMKRPSSCMVSCSHFGIWCESSEESELPALALADAHRKRIRLADASLCLSAHRSETFNSFTTSTYTLAHLHTPTMYTFVILTDPVPPPSSIPSRNSEGYSIGNASAALSGRSSFGTGGGIPGTGGMSLKGVLLQIYRGPWVDNVVKNPLLRALEREQRIVEPNQDALDSPGAATLNLVRESRLDRTHGIDTDAFREGLEKRKCSQRRVVHRA